MFEKRVARALLPGIGVALVLAAVWFAPAAAGASLRNFLTTAYPGPCTGLSVTAAPPSMNSVGMSTTFTATGTCPDAAPTYRFSYLAPGASTYTQGQAYSTSNVWVWNTTGKAVGAYNISVWVKDASSSGTFGNSDGRWDAYDNFPYTLTPPACTAVGVNAAPPSMNTVGMSTTFTATGTCPDPSPTYRFSYRAPGASTYTQGQAYSASNIWLWNTTGKPAGQYIISVWVKDASSAGTFSNSDGSWDAYDNFPYNLNIPACTALGVIAAPSSTDKVGATVTFTATGTCPDASPMYRFSFLAPGASTYTQGQAYSTNNVWAWNTTGKVPGAYNISVWVKDAGSTGVFSNSDGSWDAYHNFSYTLTGCTAVTVVAVPANSATHGATVTFTASSTCPNALPLYQFKYLAPGSSTYVVGQAYSTNNVWSWNTTGKAAGAYYISVWVKDASSAGQFSNADGTWDAYDNFGYTLT